jgi:ketopantoate reductase
MSVQRTLFKVFAAATLFAVATPATSPAQTTKQSKQVTRGNVIAALNNIDAQISKLNTLNNLKLTDIRVVNVQNLFNKNNISALNNALNKNHTEILNLRNVLNNNDVIKNVLNNSNIALDRVVAINVLSGGGGVTVFRQ